MFEEGVNDILPRLVEKGICFEWVGNPDILPARIVELLANAVEQAKNGEKMTFILAIGYGGQDEIIRGIKDFVRK